MSILLLLQTRGRMTAEQLAQEVEVSVRTIYRDVEAPHEAGVPLYGDAGRAGGYRLLDGYRTRLNGLTHDEAEAMFLAALPKAASDLGLGPVTAAAQLKIRAALPPELADRASRIQQRFYLDAPGWYHDGDESPHLTVVADAVWNQSRISVRYRRWAQPTDITRTLDPYGVVLKGGRWYVVAGSDGRIRTYRVNQILEVVTLAEGFERPADFHLSRYWCEQIAGFRKRLIQGDAVIRLSPRGRERFAHLMPSGVVEAVDDTGHEDPQREGWLRATVPIESFAHAEIEFLKFGADVEVLRPAVLRERLTRTASELAAMYQPV